MQYFLMKEDKKYVNRPIIINWMNKVSLQQIYEKKYDSIPKRMILEVKANANIEFVDIITVPFLLVSKKVKKVLQLYEPNMKFKEIILLDKKYKQVGEYVLPILLEKDVIKAKKGVVKNSLISEKMQLNKSKLDDTAVFWVKGAAIEAGIWRSDVIEAILLRKSSGFLLESIEIV